MLIPAADRFVEVDGLLAGQGAQAEVVDDEQRARGVAQHLAVVARVGTRSADLQQHLVRRGVDDVVADDARAVADRLREMALADAGGTDEADVLAAVDEGTGREIDALGLGYLGVESEVEILDRLRVLEVGPAQAQVELLGVAVSTSSVSRCSRKSACWARSSCARAKPSSSTSPTLAAGEGTPTPAGMHSGAVRRPAGRRPNRAPKRSAIPGPSASDQRPALRH